MSSHDSFSDNYREVPDDVVPDLPELPGGLPPEDLLEVLEVLPPPRPPHPGFWWSVLWCIGFIFATQIPAAVVGAVVMLVYVLVSGEANAFGKMADQKAMLESDAYRFAMGPAMLVAEVMVIGLSLLVIRLVVGRDWKRQLAVRRPSLPHVILAVLGLPGLLFLADGTYQLAKQFLPGLNDLGMPGMEEAVKVFSSWPAAFAIFVIGLGPGIGEELWCRGFLGRGLVGRYGVLVGVLFTSFFFGLIHVDPPQGTMAAVLGLTLHFTYLTTRSLFVPMLLHFLINSMGVAGSKIEFLAAFDRRPSVEVFAASMLLLAAVGWAMYQSRARLARAEADGLPAWQPDYPSVAHPPPGSGTVVVHPWPGWLEMVLVAIAVATFAGVFYQWTQVPPPQP